MKNIDSTPAYAFSAFARCGALALLSGLALSACTLQPGSENAGSEETVAVSEGALGSCGVTIDPLKSIEIVHPNVVTDARASNVTGGPWSFRTLITNMAPTTATADVNAFLRGIFDSWLSDQIVNGELVPARTGAQQVLDLFLVPGVTPHQFDLTKAPFELIAIANRLDLRNPTMAGEGRFVFGLKFPAVGSGKGFFGSMTLIMEYALPLKAPLDTPAKWAAKWHELDTLDPVGAPAAFNAKLQEITDNFSVRNAFVGRPNGSAIDQIRSNEIQLGSPWQLREFNMNSAGQMLPATTKNSPNRAAINNSQVLLDFVSQTPGLGSSDTSFMSLNFPANFGGNLFLGGRADEEFASRWLLPNGETQTNSVRVDNLGQLTCNGCHNENKAPTDNMAFYQVSPTASTFNPSTGLNDGTGRLSGFMTTGDPTKGARRPAELNRRADDMATLLCAPNAVDLVVASVKWTPASVLSGQAATFSAVVTNNGKVTKPAGAIIGVAFRVDGNLTTWSDTNTQALAPGQSVTLTANSGPSGSATWTASSGRHTLEAWVDDVNRIAEGDENNNKLTTPMVIGINLTIRNITWLPSTVSAGNAVRFSARVSNEGNIATPAGTIVGVRFDVDGAIATWSDTNTASLAAGQTVILTANSGPTGSFNWTATSGQHKLSAWADDVNRLNDVDRSDNKLQTLLAVP